jgi:hypothetical protein
MTGGLRSSFTPFLFLAIYRTITFAGKHIRVRYYQYQFPSPQMDRSKTHLDGIKLYSGDQDRVVLVVLSLGIPTEDRTKVVIRDELLVLFPE